MSNSSSDHSPLETEPLFEGGVRARGVVAALRFRCGMCNHLVVDEPGAVCEDCRSPVTSRRPVRRKPISARSKSGGAA
ncbi:hypothetical protein [Phytoactinopolyspora halotolerans]|uniref:Uncharacterized protein n=1 Tax=Phytoactinopolyspora halotolerans TaxID=1981512 RepID=A0A6L9SC05_9ACTN|nr:hypothetical protein [Phytoactinopolyspora halotolerans]NEE02068.1 hypothetical protein [Phytoactinopolyspora halotolerans]